VDTSGLTRLGSEPVRVPGTSDLFSMLINARDVLLGERETGAAVQTALARSLETLDEVWTGITQHMTAAGGRLAALDSLQGSVEDMISRHEARRATLQDVDVAEVAIELTRVQTFYEMTLAATARYMNLSLLDYL
jgi:flagellin-like hook-associated protein FlgL